MTAGEFAYFFGWFDQPGGGLRIVPTVATLDSLFRRLLCRSLHDNFPGATDLCCTAVLYCLALFSRSIFILKLFRSTYIRLHVGDSLKQVVETERKTILLNSLTYR